MGRMSMSKFCRMGNVNPISISKSTGVPLREMNILYTRNIQEFNKFIESIIARKDKKLLLDVEVMALFNISKNRLMAWVMMGIENKKIDKIRRFKYKNICDFISSGRA